MAWYCNLQPQSSTTWTFNKQVNHEFNIHLYHVTDGVPSTTISISNCFEQCEGNFLCYRNSQRDPHGTWEIWTQQRKRLPWHPLDELKGWNKEGLHEYVMSGILPLDPDAEEKPCHHLVTKVESGPGRKCIQLDTNLQLKGWPKHNSNKPEV